MLQFRKADMRDIPDIMRVVHEAQAFMATLRIDQWQDGYPEQSTLERDVALGQLYVFADDAASPGVRGSVAALAVLSLIPEPIYDGLKGEWLTRDAYLTIHRMALDDAHRGSGLAARIVAQAVGLARDSGFGSIRADTHSGNIAMRRFLEKQGFVYCGTVYYAVMKGDPLRVAYEKVLCAENG